VLNLQQIEVRERSLRTWGQELQDKINVVQAKGNKAAEVKTITPEFREWEAERDLLKRERQNYPDATKMNNSADAATIGATSIANPAGSPLAIPQAEFRGLFEAVKRRLPTYQIEADARGFEAQASVKTPFGEGAFTSGGLPPVLMPQLTQALPYEPDRLLDHFIQMAAPEAASAEWLQHTGNTNPAAPVAELAAKPDLGMQLTTHTVGWTKIAALASISTEALQDFGHFMAFLPAEIFAAVVDAETNAFVNGNGTPPVPLGLLGTSGTLTRVIGSDTPVDCLRKAFNDIRTGSSFGKANLVAMHPTTWADLQLQKATTGVYLLNPNDPNALGDLDNIFGVRVVTNTFIPAGTALVFDTTKAVIRWVRSGFNLAINGYGDDEWSKNYVTFRAELREAIGVMRPTAINIVTGLPSS
jgi:HK97 family phage major capsid protein